MLKNIFFILILSLFPQRAFAGYFNDTINVLISEKIGSNVSFETRYESQSKLNSILEKDNEIKTIILSFYSAESRSFKALVTFNDEKKIEIFGKFDPYFEIPVTTRFIRYGEEITVGDIKLVRVKRLKPGESPERDLSRLYGMQAKTNIANGEVLKMSDLKKPPVIKDQDPITLLYSSNEISLKTTGIALSAGAIGEKIRVKNEKTGIVVYGEIIDKNTVKVNSSDEK